MRRAARRDANEAEIVAALEAIGCTVYRMDRPVDLAVGRDAMNWFLEVKDGNKHKSQTPKTKAQKRFFKAWKGQVREVRTADEAVQVINESYSGRGR